MPKAPAINKAGKSITAPLANTRQSISTTAAIASKTDAIIFVVPQAILKASLTLPAKSHMDNRVTRISNISFLLKLICNFMLHSHFTLSSAGNKL
jgi:hypothetical protein